MTIDQAVPQGRIVKEEKAIHDLFRTSFFSAVSVEMAMSVRKRGSFLDVAATNRGRQKPQAGKSQ